MRVMSAPQATVNRTFDVSASEVFDAWLDPARIAQWMFGPTVREERIDHIETDARVGGRFSFAVDRHGQRLEHVGEYLLIDRPHRLSFTWGIAGQSASHVAVDIGPAGTGCELTLVHTLDPAWADHVAATRDGWAFMLETLDRELHPADGHAHRVAPATIRLERLLPGPIGRVWDHLVDPDKRALWLAGGPMELRVGGAVELIFQHADLSPTQRTPLPEAFRSLEHGHLLRGTCTDVAAPHRLAFTWGLGASPSHVAFALRAQGTQVRLSIVHSRLVSDDERHDLSCGWHAHVDTLADRLRGHEPEAFWARRAALAALYRQRESNG